MSLADLLLWTTLAALAAAAGPLFLGRRASLPQRTLGWANALAAGTMLGTAYLLVTVALERAPIAAAAGAVAGIVATWAVHALLGIAIGAPTSAAAPPPDAVPPRASGDVRMALLASAVHAAPEGVAIGAAAALEPSFGIFVALTLAVHNVWESAALASRLVPRGVARSRAAAAAVLANGMQIALAVAALLLARAFPAMLAPTLGVAFGALVYLCLAELLPESYHEAGRTSIAVVASVAMAVVTLLGGRAP